MLNRLTPQKQQVNVSIRQILKLNNNLTLRECSLDMFILLKLFIYLIKCLQMITLFILFI